MRFTNNEVIYEIEKVVNKIKEVIKERIKSPPCLHYRQAGLGDLEEKKEADRLMPASEILRIYILIFLFRTKNQDLLQ